MEKRPALGKGLTALIGDAFDSPRPTPVELDIDRIDPNAFQPRHHWDDARIEQLAQSIRSNGVIQPIVVRRVGDRYQIITGERRWRAAQRAGLTRVPVVVKAIADGQERALLEMALVENIQREDLNPIEEALAYRRLANDFQMTQDAIAAAVGKDRATVANILRLLRLPEDLRHEVAGGTLSMGQARALLAIEDDRQLREAARQVRERGLSVRETEALVKALVEAPAGRKRRDAPEKDVHTRAAEERLRLALGTRVRITRHGKRGRIEIDFTSENELIRIFEQIAGTE
jgi:ParB family chromosome partitioning protein